MSVLSLNCDLHISDPDPQHGFLDIKHFYGCVWVAEK